MKNADKMNKAAIWQWFTGQTPPTYKRPRGKNAKESDEYSISYAAIVNGNRLIIGIWQGCKGKPIGVYYITPGGSANTCTDGKNWHSGKLECIPGGGYSYGYCLYKYQWYMIYGKEEAIEWLKATFDEDEHPTFTYCTTVKDMVDRIETNINFIKRRNTRRRKEAKISAWANSMPPLPADFDTWMHETVFSDLHYAFYLKTKKKYYCTACGGEHTAKDWKHLKTYTCSRTGKTVKVDKVNDSHSARERIMLVQSHYDIDGNICSVARHFDAKAEWSISGYKQRAWSECIIPLPLDGGRVDASKIVYHHGGYKWSDKNVYGYQHKRCYCYPDVSALKGTLFGDIAIDSAAAKGWKLNYNSLMRGWYDDPRMEYLIKGNFHQLVDDITMFLMDYNAVLMPGNTIKDVLGMDGQSVYRLRDHNGGAYYARWLRTAFMCDYKLPEETVQYFVKNKISPQDVAFALNCGMSPVQVANYLQKPHEYSDKMRYSYYVKSKAHIVIQQWADYISMAKKLDVDISKTSIHRPKDLKAKHDELITLYEIHKDELERDRIESEYPNIKPTCEKIQKLYEWSDGEYEVIVPGGAFDIIRESKLLALCFDRTDLYFDRIADEESYIVFLRRVAKRDAPWYTMEIEPGGCIRQLRTYGDDEGDDREEAKEFLKKWRKEISRRVGKAEQEAAIISREKRLAEFAELRRKGNIIRNGKLSGKLLVEVLEADFRECNDEYIAV